MPGEGWCIFKRRLRCGWRHNWDGAGHWQTTTRLTYCNNDDNGQGNFDFDRYQAVQSARYQQKTWEIRGQVRRKLLRLPGANKSAPLTNRSGIGSVGWVFACRTGGDESE